jgi:hypothetical protein
LQDGGALPLFCFTFFTASVNSQSMPTHLESSGARLRKSRFTQRIQYLHARCSDSDHHPEVHALLDEIVQPGPGYGCHSKQSINRDMDLDELEETATTMAGVLISSRNRS